ncbi:Hypothetical_protein [Hexamita inflata]|uniref:Hypothetical_protein n=1 Tax=Hexamita inflata TaxID=28002 RepID=A0AA86QLH1_9EUKA|nr:Hypothetical protein HINF_LOCUS45558 [Hexamita inflata]CAI9961726.1 Hypothetical protein HINF_LOCUS49371 [Hexamita inflata]
MIYIDYDSCSKNCYKGICELVYNSSVVTVEYTCKTSNLNYYWWFMTIPVIALILYFLLFCCCDERDDDYDYDVEVRVEAQPNKVVHDLNQKTKVNANVTGIAPQGHQVTLPNGQVGIFIPQTQPQLAPAIAPQQALLYYLPQPIYQQQQPNYQQQYRVYNQPQLQQTIEMPQMPNLM